MVVSSLGDSSDLKREMSELARRLPTTVMEPQLLRLRRLITATSDQFPLAGAAWYEQGFEP